jgi:hypothetical protein
MKATPSQCCLALIQQATEILHACIGIELYILGQLLLVVASSLATLLCNNRERGPGEMALEMEKTKKATSPKVREQAMHVLYLCMLLLHRSYMMSAILFSLRIQRASCLISVLVSN